MRISKQGAQRLSAILDKHAGKNLPALWFMAATKDRVLYKDCKGDKVYGRPEEGQVSFDNTLQLFSMTKLPTSLACLQLMERGLVSLDSPEDIKRHLPELCALPILLEIKDDGTEVFAPRTKPLTLRHLLTHTSGLAYDFAHPIAMAWILRHKTRAALTPRATVDDFSPPLCFEPGSDYAYSLATDWAGVLVARITGMTLGDYFNKYIFGPIGINTDNLTFYPTTTIKSRLVHMCGRTDGGTGKVQLSKGLRPVPSMNPEDVGVHSGGAGLLGTLDEYIKLLQHVLTLKDGGGVVTPESYHKLFTSALPPREENPKMYASLGNMMALLGDEDPEHTSGDAVSHSLAFAITTKDSRSGRRAGSGFWLGAAQTHYWIDPATGIVAICATQILDLAPRYVYEVVEEYERALYDAIEAPPAAL